MREAMWRSAAFRFASDHPTAAGHFPSNPIIPGALVLDEVVEAIAGGVESGVVIRAAKFLHPVRPGESLALRWRPRADGVTEFECRLAEGGPVAVSGTIEIGAARR